MGPQVVETGDGFRVTYRLRTDEMCCVFQSDVDLLHSVPVFWLSVSDPLLYKFRMPGLGFRIVDSHVDNNGR